MLLSSGTFKIPLLDPDAPDVWIENVRDALFTTGMSVTFRAADCRVKDEVPVRLRIEADLVEKWKLAIAWTSVRRSLNSVPTLFSRSQRCRFGDIEGLIRTVLNVVQKRSQGVESRLRDELSAANLADYPSLSAYIADLEAKFGRLAAHGVAMTDTEQRYKLLRGLTSNYDNVRATILSHRDRLGNRADLVTAITMLEDYEDNVMAVSSSSATTTGNTHDATLASFEGRNISTRDQERGVCYYYSKRGRCKRGSTCQFRHVERAPGPEQQREGRRPLDTFQTRRGGPNNRRKADACRNCGKVGHWARDCRQPKQDKAHVLMDQDWNRTTIDYVGHGRNFAMAYKEDRWLVDGASTCLVANELFKEFTGLRPADVTITVGGDHRLQCTKVGNLAIATALGPVTLTGVRIVPGFGVNILSGPYLEKVLGLNLSSDGTHWWAKRRGRIAI